MCHNLIIEKPSIKQLLQLKPLLNPHICQVCLQQFERISGHRCSDCSRPLLTGFCALIVSSGDNVILSSILKLRYCLLITERCSYFQRYKGQGDYQLRLLFERDIRTRFQ